jgi:hypothetical protein
MARTEITDAIESEYLRLRDASDNAYRIACRLSDEHMDFEEYSLYTNKAHAFAQEAGTHLRMLPEDRQQHYRNEALTGMAEGFVRGLFSGSVNSSAR